MQSNRFCSSSYTLASPRASWTMCYVTAVLAIGRTLNGVISKLIIGVCTVQIMYAVLMTHGHCAVGTVSIRVQCSDWS